MPGDPPQKIKSNTKATYVGPTRRLEDVIESLCLAARKAWGNDSPNVNLRGERRAIKLEPGDTLYVLQPRIRLPEGKVLDYKEIAQLLREDKIGFYAVHYGPC